MSDDDEPQAGSSTLPDDGDLALPKATVAKFISECLPGKMTCAKDARELVSLAAKEFILAVSSEAQEICDKEQKKTMSPEHILEALKALGFDKYMSEVEAAVSDQKVVAKERVKRTTKMKGNTSGMTDEELAALQEKMLADSRARMEGGTGPA